MKTRSKIWSIILIVAVFSALVGLHICTGAPKSEAKTAQTEAQANMTESKNKDPFVHIPRHYWEKQYAIDAQKLASEEYENCLKKAEDCVDHGDVSRMEAHLIMARWCVEDTDIPEETEAVMLKDISKKTKVIRLKGYREAASNQLIAALSNAHGCFGPSMQDSLKRYKIYCLKAGMEPNGKIKKIREILAKTLAERKKLSEN